MNSGSKKKDLMIFLLVTTRIIAIKSDDIYINDFIAALKVTFTVKSASRIGLPVQDKNCPIKVVMNTEEERNRI